MAKLTVERLFSGPPLFAATPHNLQVSPKADCLTFLQSATDDLEGMDLWRLNLATGRLECWVKGAQLAANGQPTAAEKEAMERRRQFAGGISNHQWHPDGNRILLTASGAAWLLDSATGRLRQATPEGRRCTDIKLSPTGRWISYVAEGNFHIRRLEDGFERIVAASEDANISFGIADFLAQEELHRFDGHWWQNQDRWIAFTKVDLSPVKPTERYEADADGLTIVEQRYPFAGEANPVSTLALYDVEDDNIQWVPFCTETNDYLARVGFVDEGLAVQILNRAQSHLRLNLYSLPELGRHTLLEESSSTWINLHDNLKAIDKDDYLWTSERDGASHLYRYRDGQCSQLTRGLGRVNRILSANNQHALISGWFETPTQQHLYRIDLASSGRERLSEPGWHELSAADNGEWLFDHFSSLDRAGEIRFGQPGKPMQTLFDLSVKRLHPYHSYQSEHVQPELGVLCSEDGQELHYRLTKPKVVADPVPLVVQVYGGPGVQRVRNDWPPLLLQLFAAKGFGLLELDNRGSSNRNRAFEASIHQRLGDAEVRDQVRGAEFAAALPWVDERRIGVFGHSYGGYMALMCLARAPELFQAGVAVAPVADWTLYDSCYTERYLGLPATNPEGYEASAVFPYLNGIKGKLLLMHGMSDDNVVFTHSMRLMEALQKRNKPFELMTYPGAKHAMQQKHVAIHRFNLIMDFFWRHLCNSA